MKQIEETYKRNMYSAMPLSCHDCSKILGKLWATQGAFWQLKGTFDRQNGGCWQLKAWHCNRKFLFQIFPATLNGNKIL